MRLRNSFVSCLNSFILFVYMYICLENSKTYITKLNWLAISTNAFIPSNTSTILDPLIFLTVFSHLYWLIKLCADRNMYRVQSECFSFFFTRLYDAG